MSSTSSADLYHAGPLGYILEVNASKSNEVQDNASKSNEVQDNASKSNEVNPCVIVISDRSGSMGDYSSMIITQAIPDALIKMGLSSDTKVTIITFDYMSERVRVGRRDPTVHELRTVSANCRGCTQMAGVIPILKEVFTEISSDIPVSIIVISDGDVSDIDTTVRAMSGVAESIKTRPGPISVSSYRLMTSSCANPDTRALACIGQLTTSGRVPVVDIPYKSVFDAHQLLTTQIVRDNQDKLGSSCEIKASGNFMRRMPSDSPVDKLIIYGGVSTFIMISPDSDISSITCDGLPIQISNVMELNTETQLTKYLEFVDNQLRMSMVAGANSAKLAENLKYIKNLDHYLRSKVADIATGSVDIRDRVMALISSSKKNQKTLISSILALENQDKIASLNSAQAADFLRGNIKSTAVAKRATKMYGGVDYGDKCREALQSPVTGNITMPGEEISYYSQSSFSDILALVKELLPVVDNLDLEQLLTGIGGVGIAVNVIQAQYPDPWQVRIKNVHLGLYVSENDLCQMLLHSYNAPIEYPGRPGETFNAVVPIRAVNPAAYDAYQKSFRIFADLHASFALRGALACIPADKLALQCAVMVNLIRQVGPFASGTELELKTIKSLRMQIAMDFQKYSVADLALNLARDDPRPYLSGGDGVSGVLKPIAVIMAASDCAQLRADLPGLCKAVKAIYHFGVYLAARYAYRDSGREDAIQQLFGIDMNESRRLSDVRDAFEPDGEFNGNLPVDHDAAMKLAETFSWVPDLNDFLAYIRFAIGGNPINADILGDLKILRYGAVVEAILCEKEEDRINVTSRTANGPIPGDLDAIITYGNTYVSKIYRDDYNKRLAEKRTMEAELRLKCMVQNLLNASDLAIFTSLLTGRGGRAAGLGEETKTTVGLLARLGNCFFQLSVVATAFSGDGASSSPGIANRSAPGYKELQSALLDLSIDVPLRDMKLFTIITGRNRNGDPVWADGNIFIGDFKPFALIFAQLDPTGDIWQNILALKKEYGVYRYREGEDNNHGHGNDKPSYWALGFPTMKAYQLAVSPEEYEAYARLHHDCCGFRSRR
jgi:hypothetical protein